MRSRRPVDYRAMPPAQLVWQQAKLQQLLACLLKRLRRPQLMLSRRLVDHPETLPARLEPQLGRLQLQRANPLKWLRRRPLLPLKQPVYHRAMALRRPVRQPGMRQQLLAGLRKRLP